MSSTPSRSRTRRLARHLAFAVLASLTLGAAACGNNHLGRPCELGATGPASNGQIVTVASPALECPSRMCLGGSANGIATGGLCTAGCESSADCADGELGRLDDPSDTRCKSGFACMWPTTVGDFACQKLCVCRDLVGDPTGGFTKPAACP